MATDGPLVSLLAQIVRQHFGEQAEEICDALMKRPRRSLKELQTDCHAIPLGQLRNGLLILIHHNLVRTADSQPYQQRPLGCMQPYFQKGEVWPCEFAVLK